jgi:hypothetical protein
MSVQNRFLIIFGILFLIEFYVYQAFKNLVSNNWLRFGYWAITLFIYGFTLYQMLTFNRASRDQHQVQLMLSLVMIFMLPKLIALIFLLIGDISRIFELVLNIFSRTKTFSRKKKIHQYYCSSNCWNFFCFGN